MGSFEEFLDRSSPSRPHLTGQFVHVHPDEAIRDRYGHTTGEAQCVLQGFVPVAQAVFDARSMGLSAASVTELSVSVEKAMYGTAVDPSTCNIGRFGLLLKPVAKEMLAA